MTEETPIRDPHIPVHVTGLTDEMQAAVIEELDAAPNDDLRELIGQWRDETRQSESTDWCMGPTMEKCADELEELLGDGE